MAIKLNADQLRKSKVESQKGKIPRNDIYIVLDNVLDTYNIGSIFRLADAVAVKKIFLCGDTETPPNHRIKKASINTTEWVNWEYYASATAAISKLKNQVSNLQIVAIEQVAGATQYNSFEYKLPLCLIIGHESEGVSKDALKAADAIVELPMFGVNISLNVMVCLGIVLYEVIRQTTKE